MSAEQSYRIAVNGTDLGEIPLGGVLEKWRSGEIDESAYYLDETQGEWVPLAGLVKMRAERKRAPISVPQLPLIQPVASAANEPAEKANPRPKYSMPILAGIFNVLGILVIGAGLVIAIFTFIFEVRGTVPGGRITTAIGLFLIAFVQGIFLLGIGQVINYIGRIAFETERTADLLAMRKL